MRLEMLLVLSNADACSVGIAKFSAVGNGVEKMIIFCGESFTSEIFKRITPSDWKTPTYA
jgi:hypothetical protein